MSLFNEQEVLNVNQHKQIPLQELPINTSIGFYFDNIKEATSQEFGDFEVCQGLEVDLSSKTVDELIEKAQPASFIPNTLLRNKISSGAMIPGEVYRIEKVWDRFQKFKDGTKAKGYGYALFHQEVGPQIKSKLAAAYKQKIAAAFNASETPADEGSAETTETPNKPAV
jgi:hypothetical protein